MACNFFNLDAVVATALHGVECTNRLRRHEDFKSKFLKDKRDLVVYVPEGYDVEEHHRYPVLYLHDGQNLFDPTTSYVRGMDWRVDETADELIRDQIVEPTIIVAVGLIVGFVAVALISAMYGIFHQVKVS